MTQLRTFLLLLICISGVDGRTYTSTEGTSFKGELIRVKDDSVIIKRSQDKKEYTIPKSRFTKEDQEYFKNWAKENPRLNLPGRNVSRISLRCKSIRSNNATITRETGRTLIDIDISDTVYIDYDWITKETTVTATARAETERVKLKGATIHIEASSVSGPVHARIYSAFFVKSNGVPKIFKFEEKNVLVDLGQGELFASCAPVENYYGFGTVAVNLATGKLIGVDGSSHQIKEILEKKISSAKYDSK